MTNDCPLSCHHIDSPFIDIFLTHSNNFSQCRTLSLKIKPRFSHRMDRHFYSSVVIGTRCQLRFKKLKMLMPYPPDFSVVRQGDSLGGCVKQRLLQAVYFS